MRRVVCISPHFPPVNAPDMHRLRQSLPYFREFGWDPVVFTVDPQRVEGARDERLLESVPKDVAVHRVGAFPAGLTRRAGLGNLGFRSWFQLRGAVSSHLAREGADLVFFSTTQFAAVAHGPVWKRRFDVPFVVDLQDPWRNDYYLSLPKRERPRKFWFDHWQKTQLEAGTMPHASGVIAVSQAYIETMRERYPPLAQAPSLTLQFGVDPRDFEVARSPAVSNRVFAKSPDAIDLVFAGVVPPSMNRSVRALLLAARQLIPERGEAPRLRFHFIGTDYAAAPQVRERVRPIAREYGIESLVDEHVARVPYFEALRALSDADAVLLLGTDDTSYSASKFAQTMAAGRPTFSIFHRDSNVVGLLREFAVRDYVTWRSGEEPEAIAPRVAASLRDLLSRIRRDAAPEPGRALGSFHARERTREIARLFDEVVVSSAPRRAGPGSAPPERRHAG